MIPCPPWEQLEQLLAEALGDAERVPLETHVESCALCQERLQQLGGAGEPLSLSHASGVDPMPALKVAQLTDRSPAFLERMKQSPPARRSRRAPRQDDGAALPEVPGYEILGVLGHGATGVVYKARQVQLNRLVALKMILGPEHSRPEDRIRFQIEGEVVARLHHPNIVQIYEVGSHAGRPFFAFEFVDGGSLAERLDGTPSRRARPPNWWRRSPGPSMRPTCKASSTATSSRRTSYWPPSRIRRDPLATAVRGRPTASQ